MAGYKEDLERITDRVIEEINQSGMEQRWKESKRSDVEELKEDIWSSLEIMEYRKNEEILRISEIIDEAKKANHNILKGKLKNYLNQIKFN